MKRAINAPTRKNTPVLPVCIVLFVLTLIFYTPVFSAGFINHDDSDYVADNPVVQKGLTPEGIKWAFTSRHASNWHPVTWISHMMDCQLFGVNPKGHHATNVVLHGLNAVIVFLILLRLTNAKWRSAIVAALFALHPTHVESVAWVSERKDVLSTFFGLIALWFYSQYAQTTNNRRTHFYIFTFVFFILSLLSKPMLVTFPFLLLLLDIWPLQRLQFSKKANESQKPSTLTGLILEKIPFFAVAAIDCFITVWAQGEAVAKVDVLPVSTRIGNMLVSYLRYAQKLVLPIDLALPYPYRLQLPAWELTLAGLLLVGITALSLWLVRRKAYVAMGWLWFVGTLVPVIGIVQVGQQSMADRYTYIPSIGLFIAAVWGIAELAQRFRIAPAMLTAFSIGIIGLFGVMTTKQASYWKNSATLFTHSVAVTRDNFLAHNFLGMAFYDESRERAFEHFTDSVRINDKYAEAHNNLGTLLMEMNRPEEAFEHFSKAVELKPQHALSQNNLGLALMKRGEIDAAITHFKAALELKPTYADACYFLGTALRQKNDLAEAKKYLMRTLELQPSFAAAHRHLGQIYYSEGNYSQAAIEFRKLLEINPDDKNAQAAVEDAVSKTSNAR